MCLSSYVPLYELDVSIQVYKAAPSV